MRFRHSLSARLRYAFDNYMARGTIALIFALFVLSLLIVVAVTAVVLVSGTLQASVETSDFDAFEVFWLSLLRTLDPGTMGGDTGSVPFVLAMLTVTLGGIFIVATLIGVITSGIEGKLDELRKGHSRVLESNHTVILGWSHHIYEIIHEIVLANANQRRQCIVVLADRDKVDMEDEIRHRVPDTLTTRLVCRSGSPMELDDLAIASLQTSRAIIVLAPETDDPDADVIKTLLAVTNDVSRRPEPYRMVAEIRERRNVDVARLAARGEAQLVLGAELIGRIAAQTCRQPGLSVVYQDLLDFEGDEIYFWMTPELVGRQFGEILSEFRTSSVIGIVPSDGPARLNPPMDTVISEGDRLAFIAEDDDTIVRYQRPGVPVEEHILCCDNVPPHVDATLVLGWNSLAPDLLMELDKYVAPGSKLTVLANAHGDDALLRERIESVGRGLQRLQMSYRTADTTSRAVLDEVTAEGYDHVVIMSYADYLDEQRADARTLVTLLHLRDIEARTGASFTIVSEMLDVRNRALAQVTRADDFIVSGKLVSLMMAQLAENPDLRPILDDLFDEEGSEVYMKSASDYVKLGEPVDFYTVVESARRRGHVAFGYRLLAQAEDPERNYGVVMNPDKVEPVTFTAEDKVIVLAEE